MSAILDTPRGDTPVAVMQDDQSSEYAFAHSDIAHNSFKKLRLQKTFDLIAQCLIIGFVAVLVYYNWLMLVPHLTPLFWALLFSIALYKPLNYIINVLHFLDERLNDLKLKLYLTTTAIYILFLFSSSLLTIVVVSGIFAVWTFLLFGERQSVGAILLLAILCVALGLPTYYTIVTCVHESTELASKIQIFVQENPEFQTLLDDFGSSPYYLWAHDYAKQWGVELPAYDPQLIKDKIIEFSMQFTSQITQALGSVVGVLSSGVQVLVSFITFASSLYYFLIHLDTITAILPEISPFSDEDSLVLMSSLHRSVTQIFISSFLIFISHLFGTWIIFTLANVDLTLVLSVLAGFTSMLPILGSYIVWVPIAVGKLAYGQPIQALSIALVQLILQFPVDMLIYSIIPGNAFLVGFSLAMGMYLFGFIGIVFGPLLAGILITVINMYAVYQRMPRLKLKDNTIEVDVEKINQTLSLTSSPSIVGQQQQQQSMKSGLSINGSQQNLSQQQGGQQQEGIGGYGAAPALNSRSYSAFQQQPQLILLPQQPILTTKSDIKAQSQQQQQQQQIQSNLYDNQNNSQIFHNNGNNQHQILSPPSQNQNIETIIVTSAHVDDSNQNLTSSSSSSSSPPLTDNIASLPTKTDSHTADATDTTDKSPSSGNRIKITSNGSLTSVPETTLHEENNDQLENPDTVR